VKRILVVDDTQAEVYLLNRLLEKQGYSTITAIDGEEALRMAKESKPDLILMDVVMPRMNGFQATRKLAKDPETSAIPVIMVTNKDQESDRAWGLRGGAKDYLTKPVNEVELMEKIRALIGD